MPPTNILVIGAGELGTTVLHSLIHHPARANHKTSISVLLRPTTIPHPKPDLSALLQSPQANPPNNPINLIPGDIASNSHETLVSLFRPYDLVISCAGFVAGPPGAQLKITRAVLAADVPLYIPWQFGVDYEAIGRGSAHDLFDEQLDVRELLRAQEKTRWTVVSTGMFTSFLFDVGFGVVDLAAGEMNAKVRALGGWENRVTVTAPADIGKFTAEIVFGDDGVLGANGPVFVGGDTVCYAQVAELVESKLAGRRNVERSVLTVQHVLERLKEEPGNAFLKYYAVFGAGKGVAWDLEKTWNFQKGIHALTAEEWVRENLKV
ncbi:hypothetical protein AJ78_06640 [Emergomyces pasteurianus Ep9510]|uniref:NmrA-like domain-containing protein n=1 Tax=Emergomyces pasteurianus Ep9510 TaxID=1447872 RepID=A0A1J9P873_9EURO|nr:hypothetical protein AJ78_06640 [Emergomyces pasteurianus Ep9510]